MKRPLQVRDYTRVLPRPGQLFFLVGVCERLGVQADFHFDDEAEIYFPLEVLPQVAELAGAKKRRRLSEDHKAKLAESNKDYQFKPKS